MQSGCAWAAPSLAIQKPSPSESSANAALAEPTGLFSGLMVVPGFAATAAAVAVASSLFLVRHSRAQWPSLPQWSLAAPRVVAL